MCFRDRTPPLSVHGLAMAEPGIMFITPPAPALAAASPLPVVADTKLMSDSCTLFRTYIK